MKIITWNVNGIRSVINKGAANALMGMDADILCLQEIKATRDQLSDDQIQVFQDWNGYWNSAKRKGYSGVATFAKVKQARVHDEINEILNDQEGRVLWLEYPDFHLFNIYFPNGQRDHQRLQYKLDFYQRLLEICDELHNKGEGIILCGDFNTAHKPIDLKNPKQNEKTSGFLPVERDWITRYLDHGFIDAYRSLYPERVQYTWWTYRYGARQRNIGWRLDYFLVSESLADKVNDVVIHDEIPGSDHCPVSIDISI